LSGAAGVFARTAIFFTDSPASPLSAMRQVSFRVLDPYVGSESF
jgi:hypothetical protein